MHIIKPKKNDILKFLLLMLLVSANMTGIFQLLIGSAGAEGIIVFITMLLMFLLLIEKKNYNIIDDIFIGIFVYSILLTIIRIFYFDLEFSSLIGFYYFLLPCIIFINRKNNFFKKNIKFYFVTLATVIVINSLYAIYQVINPNAFIAIEGIRARGLMKSTLNYSGLLGASFFPILFYKYKSKIIKILSNIIVLIGGILTISKGFFINLFLGFILSYPCNIFLKQKISKKHISNIIKIITICAILIFIFCFIVIKTDTVDRFYQFVNILNFKSNGANVERCMAWQQFGKYFFSNPLGYGVGQIASGTTFVSYGVNFESYIFDMMYSIGIVSLFYFYIPIWYVYQARNRMTSKNYQLYLMFFIGIVIQNLIQVSMLVPATTVVSWLNLIFLEKYLEKGDINEKNISRL